MLVDIGLIVLGIAVIAVIISINGYFVAQEFAYMAVDRSTLKSMAEKGDAGATRALKVTGKTSFMLSGAQLGITITGLMVGYVAEPLVGESLGNLLGLTGIPVGVGIAVGTVTALVIATVVQIIFAELFPKNLAISNPRPLSIALSRSTLFYMAAFGWLITFFDKSSNALLKLIRVEPAHDLDASANASDLEHLVEDSFDSGDLPEQLFVLLDRILDFPERDVEHAMVPRSQADYLQADATVADARALMSVAHTRYPVIGENDEPLGVIQLDDLLGFSNTDTTQVNQHMRSPFVVPTVMTLPEVLKGMLETANEMALVIDEYGGFTGLLTIEDLGEEILGRISDEHDPKEEENITQQAENRWTVPGNIPIDELERLLGVDIPEGDWETLAGLLISEKGGLPEAGESLQIELELTPEEITNGSDSISVLVAKIVEVDRHVPVEIVIELIQRKLDRDSDDEEVQP